MGFLAATNMNPVITYLSRSDNSTIKRLMISLTLLYKKFNKKFNIPVKIFVEKDFSFENKKRIQCIFPVDFIEIELKPTISNVPAELDGLGYPIGYKNMCQFFHSEFYKYLTPHDWFMRLDTDSFITDEINYNLFEYLETNNKVYGYVAELTEWPPAVKHLDEWFEEFVDKNKCRTEFYNTIVVNGKYSMRQIYNNFEIISKEYFLNPKVQRLISEINESGNIYRWRWGDAPLRTIILSLCYEKKFLHRFRDIGYHHAYYTQKGGIEKSSLGGEAKLMFDDWKNNNNWIL